MTLPRAHKGVVRAGCRDFHNLDKVEECCCGLVVPAIAEVYVTVTGQAIAEAEVCAYAAGQANIEACARVDGLTVVAGHMEFADLATAVACMAVAGRSIIVVVRRVAVDRALERWVLSVRLLDQQREQRRRPTDLTPPERNGLPEYLTKLAESYWRLGSVRYFHTVWRWRVAPFDNINDVSAGYHLARLATCLRSGMTRFIYAYELATEWKPVVSTTFGNTGTFLDFFIGGSRGNPGLGGSGVIGVRVRSTIANMEVFSMCDDYPAAYYTDTSWRPRLQSIHWQCRRIVYTLGVISWYRHRRKFNKVDDALTNIALDTKKIAQPAPLTIGHDNPKWKTVVGLLWLTTLAYTSRYVINRKCCLLSAVFEGEKQPIWMDDVKFQLEGASLPDELDKVIKSYYEELINSSGTPWGQFEAQSWRYIDSLKSPIVSAVNEIHEKSKGKM
ncbi:hypothetical protein ON010_g16426 [Phytophthora cinnamomi]|nr:hypothetical protein ON010_g16426 [Phytophthora cinnamomi]